MSFQKDDPCTCPGIKCNCIRNKIFLGTFDNPWLLENYLTSKKKEKNELTKSYGGRNSLTLRSIPTLDRV